MLDIFSKYATDESLENNGTYRDIGNGVRVLIARSGNKRYAKRLTSLYEANRQVLDLQDDAAEAKSDEIMIQVMAETILLGWDGPLAFKGELLQYSVDNAKKLLAIKDFRRMVADMSNEMEAYKAKEEARQGEA